MASARNSGVNYREQSIALQLGTYSNYIGERPSSLYLLLECPALTVIYLFISVEQEATCGTCATMSLRPGTTTTTSYTGGRRCYIYDVR